MSDYQESCLFGLLFLIAAKLHAGVDAILLICLFWVLHRLTEAR